MSKVVNRLPALTYGRLKMNTSELDETQFGSEGITNRITKVSLPEQLPEGVSVREDVEEDEVRVLFNPYKERAKAMTDPELPGPNGDANPFDADQCVQTGMGVEVDRYMDDNQIRSTVITAAKGCKVQEPVVIKERLTDKDAAISRQVIVAEEDAELTVIVDIRSRDMQQDICIAKGCNKGCVAGGYHGGQIRVLAAKGAKVHLVISQMLGRAFHHFEDVGGVIDDDAEVTMIQMELGAGAVWDGVHMNQIGRKSRFEDQVGYLCRGSESMDMNYVAEQRGRKTNSEMVFKGVLMDEAQKTFRGTLDFRNGSTGSKGEEREEVLLLSDDVVNRTIPLILCQEEDVEGHHGASIGRLAEDLLFYLQTRGINEEAAKRMMVEANLLSIARNIPSERLLVAVNEYIIKQF